MLGLDAESEQFFGCPGHVMVASGGEDQPVLMVDATLSRPELQAWDPSTMRARAWRCP